MEKFRPKTGAMMSDRNAKSAWSWAWPGITAVGVALGILAAAATLFFFWSASSAVMLSMGAGSLVSMLQNRLLARDRRLEAAGA